MSRNQKYTESFFNALMHDSVVLSDINLDLFRNQFELYQDNQYQSARLDTYLGFRCNDIEEKIRREAKEKFGAGSIEKLSYLRDKSLTWIGLNPAQLQTPYGEFVELLEKIDLNKYKNIIDLGAGYGRLGILIGLFYPKLNFIGVELVKERVDEGNRIYKKLFIKNSKLLYGHINKCLTKSDLYFIYDYGDKVEMIFSLNLLSELADTGHRFSVVARGSAINALICDKCPWLIKSKIVLENSTLYDFNL